MLRGGYLSHSPAPRNFERHSGCNQGGWQRALRDRPAVLPRKDLFSVPGFIKASTRGRSSKFARTRDGSFGGSAGSGENDHGLLHVGQTKSANTYSGPSQTNLRAVAIAIDGAIRSSLWANRASRRWKATSQRDRRFGHDSQP